MISVSDFSTGHLAMARLVAYSLRSQWRQNDFDAVEQYCKTEGHVIIYHGEEHAEGVDARPRLQRALRLVRSNNADGLICARPDHLSCSAGTGLKIGYRLIAQGKHIVFLDPKLDTTTLIGQSMLGVLRAFSLFESDIQRTQILAGKERVRVEGGYVEGVPPFGYMNGKDSSGRKILVRNPQQYVWREQIFRWRASGWSKSKVASELNRLAIPTRNGATWRAATISALETHTKLADWAESLIETGNGRMNTVEVASVRYD